MRYSEFTTLWGRWCLWPHAAQGFSGSESTGSGMTTGSIICPSMPSARIMTGVRYLSATSNALYT